MNLIVREEIKNAKPPAPHYHRQVSKLCACGRMFVPYRSFQRYCCDAHRIKYGGGKKSYYVKKEEVEKTCLICNTVFTTNDSKRFYCTHECYLKAQDLRHVEKETRVCMVCGKKFVTSHWSKRYCSDECRRNKNGIKIS